MNRATIEAANRQIEEELGPYAELAFRLSRRDGSVRLVDLAVRPRPLCQVDPAMLDALVRDGTAAAFARGTFDVAGRRPRGSRSEVIGPAATFRTAA